jgi:hypothetical protein
MQNARYEVLCSLAILLEITANLYIHRREFTPFEKRASPQAAQAAQAAQATQAGNREAAQAAQATQGENRLRWLRTHTQGASAGKKDVVGARGAVEE